MSESYNKSIRLTFTTHYSYTIRSTHIFPSTQRAADRKRCEGTRGEGCPEKTPATEEEARGSRQGGGEYHNRLVHL